MDERRALGSKAQVAAYLGIPEKTLLNWRSQSKGPRGIKVGKHLRYRWTDVESWLEEQADLPVGGAA